MGIGDFAQKAEQYAKDNPEKVDQATERGEKFADERTDHRYDQRIGEGADQIERHFGGGGSGDGGEGGGTEGAQPDGGERSDVVRQDEENDDQDANDNHR